MRFRLLCVFALVSVPCISHGDDLFDDQSIVPCESDCNDEIRDEAVYTVRSESADFILHDTAQQKVMSIKKAGNVTEITLRCFNNPVSDQPDSSHTMRTRFVNPANKVVRGFAFKIAGSKNPVAEAERITNEYISDKRYGIPLIRSDEVIRLRSGDCTEHTVLLSAILRAAKIPTRAVVGLIYTPVFGERRNVFVYHMWAEAWYRGRWIVADASFPGARKHGRYIALSYHSLKSEMPLDYMAALASIKNLTIRRAR
jgi:transglutaminase-like putative cysteine protease